MERSAVQSRWSASVGPVPLQSDAHEPESMPASAAALAATGGRVGVGEDVGGGGRMPLPVPLDICMRRLEACGPQAPPHGPCAPVVCEGEGRGAGEVLAGSALERSDPSSSKSWQKSGARVVGSGVAGLAELVLFHPIDTIAKRLMSHQGRVIRLDQPWSQTSDALSHIVFKDSYAKSALARYASLFPGFGFAFGYKVAQRIYKFGGQPFVVDWVQHRVAAGGATDTQSNKTRKLWIEAVSGSLIGVGEIVLLPLDVLKIKAQTNPAALGGRGIVQIVRSEGLASLYKGAGWTAARNAPGSFALFGGAALVKEKVFHLANYRDATFSQNFVASMAGAAASITVASPIDVVKTRIQNKPFGSTVTGMQIIRDMLLHEGPAAFFKGLTPKLLTVGPKLVFSFAVAQHLIAYFERVGSQL